jgi:hypothetical protein
MDVLMFVFAAAILGALFGACGWLVAFMERRA